jgi:PAS domain S-box-containing protein
MELRRAQAILEVAHSAFVSMDEQGRITYWNAQAERIFGLTRELARGRPLADLIVPERYREAHWRGLHRFQRTGVGPMLGKRVELAALRADGTEFPTEMTISALQEDDKWSFHAFIADISARQAAERERLRLVDELQHALQGSEHRLSVIVNALAEAVTIRGLDNHVIYANKAALERLGMNSVAQLREADPEELLGPYEIFDEHGREVRMQDIPSVRLLRGEQPEPTLLRYVNRRSGEEEWTLLKAAAVRGADGEIEAAVTVIEDVTAAKRSAQRLEFIARAGHILASSLDYQQTLRNVADLAVPQLADWCAVDLFDEDGDHEQVTVAHIDPAKLELAKRLRESQPPELDPQRGLGVVWRTGQPLVYNDITEEMIEESARDEEHLALLREMGMRSALIVPMSARGRTIGALTLVNAESARTFDEHDLEFVEQIAVRAALAVDNSRLYHERSVIAQTLQRSLLPEALPELPGWEIAALYRPAGQGAEVGGDFYDFWEVDSQWLMMIGDVTGKGVGAAAVTSLVRHTARAAADFDAQPAQVLARIDTALKREPRRSICTALCMRISDCEGTIASGGHPLPLCLSDDGVHEIGSPGTLLGAFDAAAWSHSSFSLEPGQTLVAITDGVTDTVGPARERFGPERLREVLARVRGKPPLAIRDELAGALDDFKVGVQSDDTAIVVMRFNG